MSSMVAYISDGAGGCVYHVGIEYRGMEEHVLWELSYPRSGHVFLDSHCIISNAVHTHTHIHLVVVHSFR